jgi:hypothetical protein
VSVVGAAVILGLISALMLKLKVARASVVVVCVLFGLVLGATPIGDGVNRVVSSVGRWSAGLVGSL